MNIAIIGAGNVGLALARTFTRAGHSATLGMRTPEPIEPFTTCSIAESAVNAEIIFLTVPASAALNAASALGNIDGKIVVDCTNPLRWDKGPVWAPPPAGSNAAALAEALPGARVIKAFSTFGAELHDNPGLCGSPADLPMAGDDASAKAQLAALAQSAGFNPYDAGPLRNAAVLENLAVLWIHRAMISGEGRNFTFQRVHGG